MDGTPLSEESQAGPTGPPGDVGPEGRVITTEEAIDELRLAAAYHYEQKAMYERAVSSVGFESAQAQKRASELVEQRVRNENRPAIIMRAVLGKEGNQYTATFGELTTYGDTPEEAFDNFDNAWVGK